MVSAFAAYGEPVDGLPTPLERELHVWTNAARAAPSAFNQDYQAGGCRFDGFKADEKSPKLLLAWHPALGQAAHDHSDDMARHNNLSHNSSDGTPFDVRVSRVYQGMAIGENVAFGYGSPYDTVMKGWMCSSGHRANIMEGAFDELGTGISGTYMTQDFGARGQRLNAIRMGAHTPAFPRSRVTFLADYDAASPADAVYVVVEGERHPMDLTWGDERRGVFRTSVDVVAACERYWFESEAGETTARFPVKGAYAYGDCAFDDDGAGFIGEDGIADLDALVIDVDDDGKGCASVPRGAVGGRALVPFAGLALLAARRRRRA